MFLFALHPWEFPSLIFPSLLLLLHQSVSLHHPSLRLSVSPSLRLSPSLPLVRQFGQSSLIFTAQVVSLRGPRLGIGFYGYQPVIRGETRWKDDCSSRAECCCLSPVTHKFAIKCRIRIRSQSDVSDSLGNLFWSCRHQRFRARLSVRIRVKLQLWVRFSLRKRDEAVKQNWNNSEIFPGLIFSADVQAGQRMNPPDSSNFQAPKRPKVGVES